MEFAKIILLSVLAAVAYGVVHDQITARICIEYFTIGHPPLIRSVSPTMLGLAWGIVATWWVGLPLGWLLASAARRGSRPKLNAAQVAPAIAALMLIVALLALITGSTAYLLATHGRIALSQDWASLLPPRAQIPFLVDAWTHIASYLFGIVGGGVLAALIYRRRASAEAA